jgi:tetratricopeptide (TPR) repeat protein
MIKRFAVVFMIILLGSLPLQAQPQVKFNFTNRDKAIAHYNIAVNFAKRGMLEKAIQEFEVSVRYNPNNADAYYNMGIAYAKLDKPEEAISCYEKVLAIKPDDAHTYYNLAVAFSDLKRYEEAETNYEKAVQYKEDFIEAYANLAIIYLQQEKKDKYAAILPKIEALDPGIASQVEKIKNRDSNY